MYQTIVTVVVFLFWMCHGWILYTIDQFCQHRFGHTPRNEPDFATRAIHSSQDEGKPRHDQEIDLVSQPEKQSASLNSNRPHSYNNPENMKINQSTRIDNGIEGYVEMLEEEHQAMRHEIFQFQQKFQKLSFIVTGLEETQYENDELKREIASMRTNALEQEKQRQIAESQLMNENADLQRNFKNTQEKYKNEIAVITAELQQVTEEKLSETFALDLAMDTINVKKNLLDTLQTELHDLKIKQQEQFSVQEEKAGLKVLVASLQEVESKLMKGIEILESKLHSLDTENLTVTAAKEAAEQSLQHAEVLVDEQLKTLERLKADLELANASIGEQVNNIGQLQNELSGLQHRNAVLDRQNKEMKIDMERLNGSIHTRNFDWKCNEMILNAKNEELKKQMNHLLTENQILRAESERMICRAAPPSAHQAEMLAEQQSTSNQLYLSEFDPLAKEIPVRFPRSNWVSDFDEIDPLKVKIHELGAKVRTLEMLNESLTLKIEENSKLEEELRRTIENLKVHNDLLLRRSLVSTQPARPPDRTTKTHESAIYEALGTSKPHGWYDDVVAEEEEINEVGTYVTQTNKNLSEKKNGSKFKRWLNKRELGKQKITSDNEVVKRMQGTAKRMIKSAKKFKEKTQDLLRA